MNNPQTTPKTASWREFPYEMRMNFEFSVLTTGVILAFTQHTVTEHSLPFMASLHLQIISSCFVWVVFFVVFMWEICKTALQK